MKELVWLVRAYKAAAAEQEKLTGELTGEKENMYSCIDV